MKYICTIVLSVFYFMSFGQRGEINFFILPGENYLVMVDNKNVYQMNQLSLPVGEHNVKVYAPGYNLFDTTVTVSEFESVEIVKALSKTEDFVTFLREDQQHENKLVALKIPGMFITTAGVVFTSIKFFQTRKEYQNMNRLEKNYHVAESPDEIEGIKGNLYTAKDNFAKYNKQFRNGLSLTLASGIITTLLWKKANKMVPPVFQDKVKLEFDSYLSKVDNKIYNKIGLTYAF